MVHKVGDMYTTFKNVDQTQKIKEKKREDWIILIWDLFLRGFVIAIIAREITQNNSQRFKTFINDHCWDYNSIVYKRSVYLLLKEKIYQLLNK